MKRVYCDLCGKEIRAADIHTEIPVNVGGKELTVDMHSACYYRFIRELKRLEDGNGDGESQDD